MPSTVRFNQRGIIGGGHYHSFGKRLCTEVAKLTDEKPQEDVADLKRWAGRTAVLVDDIVSSAVTMAEIVRQWTSAGLEPPVCVGVHAVFAPVAFEMLRAAGTQRVVTTNTIRHDSNQIDVTSILVPPLRRVLANPGAAEVRRRRR
jgi:ribose-phosphate pyrophosphokinase